MINLLSLVKNRFQKWLSAIGGHSACYKYELRLLFLIILSSWF